MDAPYQARDNTAVMGAGSGGDSIFGMMPRNVVEVKRELLQLLEVPRGVYEHQSILVGGKKKRGHL